MPHENGSMSCSGEDRAKESSLKRVTARAGLVLASIAVSALFAEGVASALFNRSLFRNWSAPVLPQVRTDADRLRLAASTPGNYRAHPDPRVRYTLKAEFESSFLDGSFHTDTLGLRRRVAGEPSPQDLRVVLLGDSVAFGFGVDDEQSPAERLERILNAAVGAGRSVAVRAVACPGWNHRNQTAFLLDHWEELAPDVVVHVPVSNDLFDTDGIGETGIRLVDADASSRDPWLAINQNLSPIVLRGLAIALEARHGIRLGTNPVGADLVGSDLVPESSARFDANAASIREVASECARRGARFAIAPYLEDMHTSILRSRLADLNLVWIPLLRDVPRSMQLEGDPHPNADAIQSLMSWVARDLVNHGLVPGIDVARIPIAEGKHAEHRAALVPPGEAPGLAEARRRDALAKVTPTLDLTTGEGVLQIVGGFHPDGALERHSAFGLLRRGRTLSIDVESLADVPGLYPQSIDVYADGARLGTIEVTVGATAHGRWTLPEREAGDLPVIEVRLSASRVAMTKLLGMSRVVGAQFVRASCQ